MAAAANSLVAASPFLGPILGPIVATISASVGAISAGGASACGVALARSEKASGALEEAWNSYMRKEYISKIRETASNSAELSQFKTDPNRRNAVEAGHELGREMLRYILETQATEETRKFQGKILPIITGPEASGIEFATDEDKEHYAHLIFKGVHEDPSDKAS